MSCLKQALPQNGIWMLRATSSFRGLQGWRSYHLTWSLSFCWMICLVKNSSTTGSGNFPVGLFITSCVLCFFWAPLWVWLCLLYNTSLGNERQICLPLGWTHLTFHGPSRLWTVSIPPICQHCFSIEDPSRACPMLQVCQVKPNNLLTGCSLCSCKAWLLAHVHPVPSFHWGCCLGNWCPACAGSWGYLVPAVEFPIWTSFLLNHFLCLWRFLWMSALPCMGHCDDSLGKIKENDIYCLPLIHGASHHRKCNQADQTWFAYDKSVLAVPIHLPVLPGYSFSENLFPCPQIWADQVSLHLEDAFFQPAVTP